MDKFTEAELSTFHPQLIQCLPTCCKAQLLLT